MLSPNGGGHPIAARRAGFESGRSSILTDSPTYLCSAKRIADRCCSGLRAHGRFGQVASDGAFRPAPHESSPKAAAPPLGSPILIRFCGSILGSTGIWRHRRAAGLEIADPRPVHPRKLIRSVVASLERDRVVEDAGTMGFGR